MDYWAAKSDGTIRMVVLEKQLVEKLENVLKSKKKVIKFSELANR